MDCLVSVLVISYNSENYIVDTLESIKNQTYQHIELIISDDGSSDATVMMAKQWINNNAERFIDYRIVESVENTGIPANANRGLKACKGIYIKTIAADDILFYDCVEKYVSFALQSKAEFMFSKARFFENNIMNVIYVGDETHYTSFELSAQEQYKKLLIVNFITAPTFFFKKDSMIAMGMFNERYKLLEDLPMWVKITSEGRKLYFLDDYTVYYRFENNSVSNSKKVINENYYRSIKQYFKEILGDKQLENGMFSAYLSYKIKYLYYDLVILCGNDRKSIVVRLLKVFLLLSPLYLAYLARKFRNYLKEYRS